MNIKKEARLLLISELDGYIVATVIRGYAGIEGIVVFNSCTELQEALKLGKGLLAEVNYVVSGFDLCKNMNIRSISTIDIEDKDVEEAIKETAKIISLMKLRYLQSRLLLNVE
ncbi:MAG: hypothetical protein QW775_01045 [Ignisphaera sp.]|uniref:Uncharacterized protein n=1 Tax=Ignisphaera aggregans TaxID=334771 RepID=A0A7C4NMM1_9CREN